MYDWMIATAASGIKRRICAVISAFDKCVVLMVHCFLARLAASVLQLYLQLSIPLVFLVELDY
jgi:hypothetical protein